MKRVRFAGVRVHKHRAQRTRIAPALRRSTLGPRISATHCGCALRFYCHFDNLPMEQALAEFQRLAWSLRTRFVAFFNTGRAHETSFLSEGARARGIDCRDRRAAGFCAAENSQGGSAAFALPHAR